MEAHAGGLAAARLIFASLMNKGKRLWEEIELNLSVDSHNEHTQLGSYGISNLSANRGKRLQRNG